VPISELGYFLKQTGHAAFSLEDGQKEKAAIHSKVGPNHQIEELLASGRHGPGGTGTLNDQRLLQQQQNVKRHERLIAQILRDKAREVSLDFSCLALMRVLPVL
jgi:hypothetical protein